MEALAGVSRRDSSVLYHHLQPFIAKASIGVNVLQRYWLDC